MRALIVMLGVLTGCGAPKTSPHETFDSASGCCYYQNGGDADVKPFFGACDAGPHAGAACDLCKTSWRICPEDSGS